VFFSRTVRCVAEQFAVELGVEHDHPRALLVLLRGPATTGTERHVEHRKEVRRDVVSGLEERSQRTLQGTDRRRTRGHRGLPIRAMGTQQVHRIRPGQVAVGRTVLGALVAHQRAGVELRHKQLHATAGQWIARHHMQHGDHGHAGADAQADGKDHQRGKHLAAFQAA
jgi:hypothetical protein